MPNTLSSIPDILEDVSAGRIVIILDDADRENEGDLFVAAARVQPEHIAFMATFGRGLICVPMTGDRLDQLDIPPMTTTSGDPYRTAWMMSVDARLGVTTGISAHDRARTIRALVDPETQPTDLIRPGHLFPLRAVSGGVRERPGHTESAVELSRLAGLPPAGVICEIMCDDGHMARLPELTDLGREHGLKMCTVRQIQEHLRSWKENV